LFGVADYWAFVVAVIVFLAIPGVGNLAIITSTGKGRIAGGLAATFGVIVADQILMWLAVAGVAAILTANPALFGFVQYAGALYLAYLGIRMILSRPGDAPVLDMKPRRFFRQAMLNQPHALRRRAHAREPAHGGMVEPDRRDDAAWLRREARRRQIA
jgi:threonine/homoserine/homoserine lactone efflux protein